MTTTDVEMKMDTLNVSTTMAQLILCLVLATIAGGFKPVQSQTPGDDTIDARTNTSALARDLANQDPIIRQRAGESLARLAAVDQKKLVEGYLLQEKKKNVRLALNWALYRMGKSDALFEIIRELDSSRHDQAVGYLAQLESPALLYGFLKQGANAAKTTVGVIEALGRIGDASSLGLINPFRDSFAPGVAEAAEVATEQIQKRIAQTEPAKPSRPRTVGKTDATSP